MGLSDAVVAQFGRPNGQWGRIAGLIMSKRPSNLERGRWTLSLLDVRPSDRVLEIGFGPGVAIQQLSEIVTDGVVVGIDHSEVMLRQAARRNAAAIQAGRVVLHFGSVSRLPDFGGRFDKIFAINSMMFWDEPGERLKDLRRLLKPGGVMAITHQPRVRGATDGLTRRKGADIAAALERAGYSNVRVEIKEARPVAVVCVLGSNAPD